MTQMDNNKTNNTSNVETPTANGKPVAGTESNAAPKMEVKLIMKEELNKMIEANEPIQVVNVLDPAYYNLGFIKGSKLIPLDKMDERISELDKSKAVVTYCASSDCNASKNAAKKLMSKGFDVSAYEGGIKEWKEAGLPTEA